VRVEGVVAAVVAVEVVAVVLVKAMQMVEQL
jgi:hypothetical protein